MKVTVFGTGYVGLVTGVCLAEIGHEVLCVDVDAAKLKLIEAGKSPIYEPGLDELLTKNLTAGRFKVTLDALAGVQFGDFIFIAVGTPAAADGTADLHYVYNVAENIGKFLDHEAIIVDKSTVPVGTGDHVEAIIGRELAKRNLKHHFAVVANPEFLKQGDAVQDFLHADRIIVGSGDEVALQKMQELYRNLNQVKVITMDRRSAELTKYAANAFLATKISFINEIAQFAEKFGADVAKIRDGIGSDPRIGYHFLRAGCGYGGSCFPKDVSALIGLAREYGIESPLFNAVENINLRQKHLLFNRVHQYLGNLEGKRIALWGLAFKPDTDDMREAPSRVLMESLWRTQAIVQAYDPVAEGTTRKLYGERNDLILCATKEETLQNADLLVIVTEWKEFLQVDWNLVKNSLRFPVVFDGRNLFEKKTLAKYGIEYHGIGRL